MKPVAGRQHGEAEGTRHRRKKGDESERQRDAAPNSTGPARWSRAPSTFRWRLVVASDLAPTEQAVRDFNRSLALSLAGLGLLLVLAALAQINAWRLTRCYRICCG